MDHITPLIKYAFRSITASVWYDTDGLSKNARLYCKARELISGDRAEREINWGSKLKYRN